MKLALYALLLSGVYATIALLNQRIAEALTVLFVAAIVVPAVVAEYDHHRRTHRGR